MLVWGSELLIFIIIIMQKYNNLIIFLQEGVFDEIY